MNCETNPVLDVLSGREPRRRPIWFMRQAGRYLPEYRKLRAQAGSFLNLCRDAELAAEVTLQPLRRFDLDAAILFADILLVPSALGVDLEFRQNEGPVLKPVRSLDDVRALHVDGVADRLSYVYRTLERVARDKPASAALIGFCGAPWTVASYMVEGGTSPERINTRLAAHGGQAWFDELIDVLVSCSVEYLERQVHAGAEVVQIFDTWACDLDDRLLQRYCFRPIGAIVEGLRQRGLDVPVIGFARGIGVSQLAFAGSTGVNAVGVETSAPVDWMGSVLARQTVVQGNLDPISLISGGEGMMLNASKLTTALAPHRHIFNLGHGIRPVTPVDNVASLIAHVRALDERG